MRYKTPATAKRAARLLADPREFRWDTPEFELALYIHRIGGETDSHIGPRLLDWAVDTVGFREDMSGEEFINSVINTLDWIDCAGCFAPPGLIYNHDIAREVADCWQETDDSLAEYLEETGEHAMPRDGAATISWMVWFAYEWQAHKLASLLRSIFSIDE